MARPGEDLIRAILGLRVEGGQGRGSTQVDLRADGEHRWGGVRNNGTLVENRGASKAATRWPDPGAGWIMA